MKQLKPQDAQFLYMEDGQIASHVTSVQICDQSTAPDGAVRFKDILKCVEERLGNSPLYSQKLMRLPFDLDFPYWVEDPHFDLEYHVRHGRLPAPADWRQFCIHVARFHSRPLDLTRPPWEIYVVEGLNKVEGMAKGSFAMVTKMHHAAVDGTSAQEFMLSIMDLSPKGGPVIPPAFERKKVGNGAGMAPQILMRAAINNATAPARMANAAMRLAPNILKAAASAVAQRGDKRGRVPHTRFNGDISPNRAFDAVSFDLKDFKKVAKAFDGAKINDVVLAVCGGALREYLIAKNELPAEPLVATAPINLRGKNSPGSNDRGPNDNSGKSDGNNISAMTAPLFTNVASPSERLKSITRATQSAKAAKSGFAARIMTDLAQHIPAASQALLTPLLLNNPAIAGRLCNAFISNIPGVQFPVYLCGAEVTDFFGMAPIGAGVGLFIATPSYNGKLTFSITTTRQIMPDTPVFMDFLRAALADLKSAAEKRADRQASELGDGKKSRKRKRYHRVKPVPVHAPKKPMAAAPKRFKSDAKPGETDSHAGQPNGAAKGKKDNRDKKGSDEGASAK